MDAHDTVAFKKHIRQYIAVFVALLVATVLTVAVSYVHFGAEDSHVGNVTVALIIATVQGSAGGRIFHASGFGEALDLRDAGHHRGFLRGVDRADGYGILRHPGDAWRVDAWSGGDGGGGAWALKRFIWFLW
jgi:hypothetical protein